MRLTPILRATQFLLSMLVVAGCAAATPAATPRPTPSPPPTAIDGGTITLTDAGCIWEANPGAMAAGEVEIALENETDDYGLFIVHRLKEGNSWARGQEAIDAIAAAIAAGAEWPEWAISVSAPYGEGSASAGGSGRVAIDASAGTYGVVCSANTSSTGDVLSVFLVGPLEVTAP